MFLRRYLEPVESLGEILFGLIMVLTFTLGAALAGGRARHVDLNPRRAGLVLAALGLLLVIVAIALGG